MYSNDNIEKIEKSISLNTSYCAEHMGEKCNYFCFNCSKLICSECAIHGSHHEHKVMNVRKAMPLISGNIKEIKIKVESCSKKIRDLLLEEESKKEKIFEDLNNSKNLLREAIKKIIDSIKRKENNLIEMLDSLMNNYINSYKISLSHLGSKYEEAKNFVEAINCFISNNDIVLINRKR